MAPISDCKLLDCMEGMKAFPDKFFDLAVVDPPYGIGVNHNMGRRAGDKKSNYKAVRWDAAAPSIEYFVELFRVSKNQIIWGANHFISKMPIDSPCWLLWDKIVSLDMSFAQYEMAWTSFKGVAKKFELRPTLQQRIHPTEKPYALYAWILENYAKPGDKILDTHLGSMSSRIAAYKMGFDFWGFEIDPDYFRDGDKRFRESIAMPLFDGAENIEQGKLF